MMAEHLQQAGWGITTLSPVKQPDYSGVQAAELVLVGTWVHGLFVVGQAPWGLGTLEKLPAMKGKKAAAFCTYALNPGKSLQKMTGVLDRLGAEVLGGVALHRAKLPQHTEEDLHRLTRALVAVRASVKGFGVLQEA